MWSQNNGRKRNRNLRGQGILKSLKKHRKLEGVFVKDLQVLEFWSGQTACGTARFQKTLQ
jgi:hypothetical protein